MITRGHPFRRAHRASLRRSGGEGGFTLLELLLATAIGAVVLLVINTTFFGALRLHNTTHEKIDQDLVLQRTLGIVRKDLAGIMLPANPQATTNTLSGQLMSDSFSTNAMDNTGERITPDITTSSGMIDGWTPFAEVQTVAYYLTPATDGGPTKDLVRVVTRNLLPAADPIADTYTLLPGVLSATLAYFDGEYWSETWDSTATSTLPSAFKFSLVMAPRGDATTAANPGPVELIVPVYVTTPTSAQLAADAAAAAPLL
ncbi:MAG: prepilin-type N-terminal cleavage/methylation domain-containing protein [Opitutaceae bacterium]|nr:prepilin-type N-terminal cleavage/methylation domain-containing protein [Opitutaceae bacterium]